MNNISRRYEHETSSSDSEFDSDYDDRLDESFNKILKEMKDNPVKHKKTVVGSIEVKPLEKTSSKHSPQAKFVTYNETVADVKTKTVEKNESCATNRNGNKFVPSIHSKTESYATVLNERVVDLDGSWTDYESDEHE